MVIEHREPEHARLTLLIAADHRLAMVVRPERILDDGASDVSGDPCLQPDRTTLVAEGMRHIAHCIGSGTGCGGQR